MNARLRSIAENPPRWILRLAGHPCMFCKERTIGAMRWGNGLAALRVPLCEACHQKECPEVPHR